MKLVYCKSADQVAEKALKLMEKALKDKGKSKSKATSKKSSELLIFTPTGQTPRPLYKLLAQKKIWSKKLIPIQIDEFVDDQRLFFKELSTYLLKPMGLAKKVKAISSKWSDEEMAEHIQTVLNEGIDVALLGLGPNGHVGFHEPSSFNETFMGGRVNLSEQSVRRVEGASVNQALTFGVGSFLKAKIIILIVTGESKREILKKFLNAEPVPSLPASYLKRHKNLIVLTDIQIQ